MFIVGMGTNCAGDTARVTLWLVHEMRFASSSSEESEREFKYQAYGGHRVRLIQEHSLWSHVLFNASKFAVDQIQNGLISPVGKAVLEIVSAWFT